MWKRTEPWPRARDSKSKMSLLPLNPIDIELRLSCDHTTMVSIVVLWHHVGFIVPHPTRSSFHIHHSHRPSGLCGRCPRLREHSCPLKLLWASTMVASLFNQQEFLSVCLPVVATDCTCFILEIQQERKCDPTAKSVDHIVVGHPGRRVSLGNAPTVCFVSGRTSGVSIRS